MSFRYGHLASAAYSNNGVQPSLTLHGIKSGLRLRAADAVVPRYIMKEANFSSSFNTLVSPLKSVFLSDRWRRERERAKTEVQDQRLASELPAVLLLKGESSCFDHMDE